MWRSGVLVRWRIGMPPQGEKIVLFLGGTMDLFR